ncbi:MAG: twin-arginine translocase TatA/TatE family subunit [Peptococcaceae bacterium]|nr:twin-arginine translocase TatA/TatE family subunit [Peptococcaceae bacterium]
MSMTGIIVLLVAALVLFGPEEMPKIARTLGKLFRQGQKIYQAYVKDFRDMIDEPLEEVKKIEKGFTKSINSSLDLSSLAEVLEEKPATAKSAGVAGANDVSVAAESADVAGAKDVSVAESADVSVAESAEVAGAKDVSVAESADVTGSAVSAGADDAKDVSDVSANRQDGLLRYEDNPLRELPQELLVDKRGED